MFLNCCEGLEGRQAFYSETDDIALRYCFNYTQTWPQPSKWGWMQRNVTGWPNLGLVLVRLLRSNHLGLESMSLRLLHRLFACAENVGISKIVGLYTSEAVSRGWSTDRGDILRHC